MPLIHTAREKEQAQNLRHLLLRAVLTQWILTDRVRGCP